MERFKYHPDANDNMRIEINTEFDGFPQIVRGKEVGDYTLDDALGDVNNIIDEIVTRCAGDDIDTVKIAIQGRSRMAIEEMLEEDRELLVLSS